jgi:hypothetical protein
MENIENCCVREIQRTTAFYRSAHFLGKVAARIFQSILKRSKVSYDREDNK